MQMGNPLLLALFTFEVCLDCPPHIFLSDAHFRSTGYLVATGNEHTFSQSYPDARYVVSPL
jgi:hypothetical protein